jgi:hypothetical protein
MCSQWEDCRATSSLHPDATSTQTENESKQCPSDRPGLDNVKKLPVLVFPKLLICARCGMVEFTLTPADLRLLTNDNE